MNRLERAAREAFGCRAIVMITEMFWRTVLRIAPTGCIQRVLCARPGVTAKFVLPGETETVTVTGVCWLIVSED